MAAGEPILNVPRGVSGAAALMAAVQLIRGLLPDEVDLTLLLALAFIPARYSGAAAELPGGYLTCVTSFFTYMVVHAGWVHLVVNVLWMLAFGSAVARRVGDRKFVVFSVMCGVAGAVTHLVCHFGEMAPVVGASAAISGQMAGALHPGEAGRPPFTRKGNPVGVFVFPRDHTADVQPPRALRHARFEAGRQEPREGRGRPRYAVARA